jgi:glycerate kinase
VSGFDVVAEAAGLAERLGAADAVVTGEGSFDAQSFQGKVTGRLLGLARERGIPCVVFAGQSGEPGVPTLAALAGDAGRAMREASPLLEELAARWAAAYPTD